MCRLQKILRRAVQVLFAARKIDEKGVHNYYMSGMLTFGALPEYYDCILYCIELTVVRTIYNDTL